MAWWHRKPKITKNFEELTQTYNDKYGNHDYNLDSRSLDLSFRKALLDSVGDIAGQNVLVCGSNSGYEIRILAEEYPSARLTAVDISTEALKKLSLEFPTVSCIHATMEALPFNDKEFDSYLNCRAIHSTDVDMATAINEAVRVTSGKIVLSISNGYKVGEKIVNGMYDYDAQSIDQNMPVKVAGKLKELLEKRKYNLSESFSEAELFLIANPV